MTQTNLDIPPRLLHNADDSWPPVSCAPDGNLQDAPVGNTERPGYRPVAPAAGFRAEGVPPRPDRTTRIIVREKIVDALIEGNTAALIVLYHKYPAIAAATFRGVYAQWAKEYERKTAQQSRDARNVAGEACDVIIKHAPNAAMVSGGDFGDGSGDYITLKDPVVARQEQVKP